jgi:hypothetical protein
MYSRSLCEPKNVNSHGQGRFYFSSEVVEIWEKASDSFYKMTILNAQCPSLPNLPLKRLQQMQLHLVIIMRQCFD